MNLNKYKKGKTEILNNLSDKQISILTKRLCNNVLRNRKKEDVERYKDLLNFYREKDFSYYYDCLCGSYECMKENYFVLSCEKDLFEKRFVFITADREMSEFIDKVNLLKLLILISEVIENDEISERINTLIENIYVEYSVSSKHEYDFITKLKKSQERLISEFEDNKQFLKENREIEVDKELIKSYEFYLEMFDRLADLYFESFEEFKILRKKIEN